ncbi:MAG: autotransporter-associated beta strand repeat-containing protein [Kiritimatiellae bacterium]|nr:autotransporter-associated beta strand repeat-containing protein [Kiritimatiellia bacterium]
MRNSFFAPVRESFLRRGLCVVALSIGWVATAVSEGEPFVWNGADGGSWDAETQNWLDGETPCAWVNGTNALFAASAAGITVSIDGEVQVTGFHAATGGAGVTLTNGTIRLADNGTVAFDSPLTVYSGFQADGLLSVTGTTSVVYEPFLTKTSKLIFPGLKLEDITSLQANMGGRAIRSGQYTLPGFGYHYRISGTTATVQFQCQNGGLLLCVRVEFSEEPDGIYARAVSACYKDGWLVGVDLDVGGTSSQLVATSLATDGYGVCNIRATTARLRLAGDSSFEGRMFISNTTVEVTSTNAQIWSQNIVSTNGGVLAVRGLSEDTVEITRESFVTTSASATVFTNAFLWQMMPVGGKMSGKSIQSGNPAKAEPALPYQIRYDSTNLTMTCQFQIQPNGEGTWIKGVKVEFKQEGANVTARSVKAYYWPSNTTLGADLDNSSGVQNQPVATGYTVSGYGMATCVLRVSSFPHLTLGGVNTVRDMVVDNARLTFTNKSSYIGGMLLARNGAKVVYAVQDGAGSGIGTARVRRFESGSWMIPVSNMNTEEYALFILDDSTLYTPMLHPSTKDGRNYINSLTLRNGGRAIGNPLRCGTSGNGRTMTYTSEGTNANWIASGINMVNGTGTATNKLVLATSADLIISGKIYDFVQNADKLKGMQLIKRGAANLILSGTNTFEGSLTVEAGTVTLASNAALPPTAPLVLTNQCTVSCGTTTNATGVLKLAGNGTISLGDGALSFADSSETEWMEGVMLTVTGTDDLPTRSLRFGTSASGLTPTQLKQIRYNGEKVALNDQGYLRRKPNGTVILIN